MCVFVIVRGLASKKKKEKKKKPMGVWLFPEKHNHGCGQLFVTKLG